LVGDDFAGEVGLEGGDVESEGAGGEGGLLAVFYFSRESIPPLDGVVGGLEAVDGQGGAVDDSRCFLIDDAVPPGGAGVEEPEIGAVITLVAQQADVFIGEGGPEWLEAGEGDIGEVVGQGAVMGVGILTVELIPPPEEGGAGYAAEG